MPSTKPVNADAALDVEGFHEKACRAYAKILLRITDHVSRALDGWGLESEKIDRVMQIDEREDGFKQMLAVRASAQDVQKEIEFGRGG